MDAPLLPPDDAPQPGPLHPDRPRPTRLDARAGADKAAVTKSVTFKIIAIGAIILVLLVPMLMLGGLISERESLRDGARREVSAQWGQEQTLGGPVLTVPYTVQTRSGTDAATTSETRYVHLFPDRLDVTGTMEPQVRQRGIFKVVLYNAQLAVTGQFPVFDAASLGVPAAALRTDEAFLQIGIPDMAGLRDGIRVNWNGTTRDADPGIATTDVFSSGVSVPVQLTPQGARFAFTLNLNGSGSLGVLPVGKTTTVRLTSPWDTPSFTGAFLPDTSTVTASGFEASWKVLHLNRNYPQLFTGQFGNPTRFSGRAPSRGGYAPDYESEVDMAPGGSPSAFGVVLLLPVDEYQKTDRAAKYGMLFVFLTFLTFFFVEILGDTRIHPIQYLLVGFAVTLFYLLLLAFAEYMPFDGAYGLAAVAILGLVTLYARAVFGGWRLAGLVGGLLALFYGYFYVLLQQEQYALLLGSLGLLVTLAAVMYLSRRVDWYAGGLTPPRPPEPTSRPADPAPDPVPVAEPPPFAPLDAV